MADAAYASLPFAEQIAFFRAKLNLPTQAWTDIYKAEHDFAFVVAGASRDAIVADFRAAVEKAIAEGTTLEQFRKDFDAIVQKHGWGYNGGRNWRSRVIYETNLNTSYAAGRFEQLQAAPFWQYQHADWVAHPRHQHKAWDGLVLARDDPWWRTHYPPNGWGCQCSVRGLWPRDLKRLGKDGPDEAPAIRLLEREIGKNSPNGPRLVRVPEGIDPGFEYVPGRARLEARQEMEGRVARHDTGGTHLSAEQKLSFAKWADAVLDEGYRSKNEFVLVGFIPEKVLLDEAVAQLLAQGAEIHTSDQLLRHGYRPNKLARGAALDKETLAALPQKLEEATWYFDAEHGNVVAIFEIGQDDAVGKAVVQFNYARSKRLFNAVITTGVVKRFNLNDPSLRQIT